ncbi:septum formation family protein [Plantactinospora sp. GCM10030261]|uniref:septum formation family protein n=1 Tax=Plantactinospora sp. GCM10030261 TaxID=3273420 RepID=UPI0036225B45
MRRWFGGITLVAVAVVTVTLTGCSTPAGVDANLIDDWAPLDTPKVWTPISNTCHPQVRDDSVATFQPVDCGRPHRAETVHVGEFDGDGRATGTPPAPGSAPVRAAYQECDRAAREVVGADWRIGRLAIALILPRAEAWTAGARWYRCDLQETRSLDDDTAVVRTASLRGALMGPSPLAHGCFQPKLIGNEINFMEPVSCDAPHRAEFAGIHRAPDSTYEVFERNRERIHRSCMSTVATFAGLPDNNEIGVRVGSIIYRPDAAAWALGERGVQCFLWVSDRDLTRSAQGAGPTLLPAA